jgi:hypothetical protein
VVVNKITDSPTLKCYATVDYLGTVYKGAERVANVWYFEDVYGAMIPFVYQKRVKLSSDLASSVPIRPVGADAL